MKQVIAIIRKECLGASREALARLGIEGVVVLPVQGRGLQKGAIPVPDSPGALGRIAGFALRRLAGPQPPARSGPPRGRKTGLRFLPKQMLIIMAEDAIVPAVVRALIGVNQSGRHGDGKIFVCPIGRELDLGTGSGRPEAGT